MGVFQLKIAANFDELFSLFPFKNIKRNGRKLSLPNCNKNIK
jgi:hypothetical protein